MANHVDLMKGLPGGSRSFRVTIHTSAMLISADAVVAVNVAPLS